MTREAKRGLYQPGHGGGGGKVAGSGTARARKRFGGPGLDRHKLHLPTSTSGAGGSGIGAGLLTKAANHFGFLRPQDVGDNKPTGGRLCTLGKLQHPPRETES